MRAPRAAIDGGLIVLDHNRAIHVRRQRLDELERRGQNHVETKRRKDGHGSAGKGGIGAVKGLIQNDGTIGGHVLVRLRQPEAQGRSQAEEDELLCLAARQRGGILIGIGCRSVGVQLTADKAHVPAGI